MARRSTNLLLILVYLATQMAGLPHAHGEGIESHTADHNTRPHTHVSWFDSVGHRQSDHSHAHHQSDEHHSRQHGDQHKPTPPADTSPEQEHDSDAVYLSAEIGIPTSANIRVVVDSLAFVPPLAMNVQALVSAPDHGESTDFLDNCTANCPLYLLLRSLRI